MPARVYIETTVVSYLTSWPSEDVIRAAHQQITRDWWNRSRPRFDVYTSRTTLLEAGRGDSTAAADRLLALQDVPVLEIVTEAEDLADALAREIPLPARAEVDALHIALATVHGMDYLLTWNCAHIANASFRGRIEEICKQRGYGPPVICTPEELPEEAGDV